MNVVDAGGAFGLRGETGAIPVLSRNCNSPRFRGKKPGRPPLLPLGPPRGRGQTVLFPSRFAFHRSVRRMHD